MRAVDLARPIATRDGRVAILERTDGSLVAGGYRYPVVARVEHPNEPGEWVRHAYMADGRWKSNDPCNGNDLVNIRVH